MTPDGAINRLTTLIVPEPSALYPRETEAVKLGIEALKLYKTIKADGLRSKDFRLPGETAES